LATSLAQYKPFTLQTWQHSGYIENKIFNLTVCLRNTIWQKASNCIMNNYAAMEENRKNVGLQQHQLLVLVSTTSTNE